MKVTYYGHSCFLIEIDGKKIIFDPFISANELANNIDISQIKVDYIFLSHGHQDHVADVEMIYKNSENPLIVGNFEVVNWFGSKGLENFHPMNHGGSKSFDFGSVKMVNAIHSSNMPDGSYGGNPAGFVFKTKDSTFYYAGDTALTYDMKLIAEEFDVNFAFLPIGDNFTMGISDALKAADFVATNKIIGMHFDTFGFIKIDQESAIMQAKNMGKELLLMNIGETINL